MLIKEYRNKIITYNKITLSDYPDSWYYNNSISLLISIIYMKYWRSVTFLEQSTTANIPELEYLDSYISSTIRF